MRADAQLCAVRPCSRAEPTRSRRTDAALRRAAHRRDVQAKLVVAKVKEVGFVENSDKLYLCQVQVGPDEVRQVVTGLRKHVPQEVLEGATVMTIINLKTAKLAGQLSAAMIMCGVTDGKAAVLLLCFSRRAEACVPVPVYDLRRSIISRAVSNLSSSAWRASSRLAASWRASA